MKSIQVIILLLFFHFLLIAQPSKNGTETQVNTTTANTQQRPAIAMDKDGNYVIVWESYGTDGSGYGIYFQRYSHLGIAQGSETIANTIISDNQRFPDIAMDKNGKFTIVWQSDNQDGDGLGIYAAMFNADGTVAKSEFKVNTTTSSEQRHPSIAMEDDGGFVITWTSPDADQNGIFMQRFDKTGTVQGSETAVNTNTTHHQDYSDVAIDKDGNYIVVWQSSDGSGNGISFQRFDYTGIAEGSETIANTTTSEHQQNPKIAADSTGNFIIVWESYNQDFSGTYDIYAQRFSGNGTTNGSETLINSTTPNHQNEPQVAMTKDGQYIITWSSYGTDGSFCGVYLQAFNSNGIANGNEIGVNTRTTDFQQKPAIALSIDNSSMTITWQDGMVNSHTTHDGDDYGIYHQKYTLSSALPVELFIFTGRKVSSDVLLEWQTVTEINNAHFDVEWSKDGIAFERIGEVAGAGTTNKVQFYEFLHKNPVIGQNYYRLKQVDFDGKFEYTNILNIEFQDIKIKYQIYPNPATHYIIVTGMPTGERVQIFNVNGQLVKEFQTNSTSHHALITDLPSGTYFVKIGEQVKKLIIQK
jgi:hypothetical protein